MRLLVIFLILSLLAGITVSRRGGSGLGDHGKDSSVEDTCPLKSCQTDTSRRIVDCTRTKGQTQCGKIPRDIPENTEVLLMGGNKLSFLPNKGFIRLKNLIHLSLDNCSIHNFGTDAFKGLARLKTLNLTHNSRIEQFPMGLFSPLSSLTALHLRRTKKQPSFDTRLLAGLYKLTVLALGENQLMRFPKFQSKTSKSILPALRELSLEMNNFEFLTKDDFKGLNSLRKLNLQSNRLFMIRSNAFADLRKLAHLELDRNFLSGAPCGGFLSVSLKFLSMSFLEFESLKNCTEESNFFERIPYLKVLNLSHSPGFLRAALPFQYNNSINELTLRGTRITDKILARITSNIPGLRKLDLQENDLNVLYPELFHSVTLDTLRVGLNWLASINATSLPVRLWKSLKRVDFSGNPFYCDCDLVWFRRWCQTTDVIIENSDRLLCNGPNTLERLVDIGLPEMEACFRADPDLILPVVFTASILACVLFAILSTLHRFRWHVKYWLFKRKKAMHDGNIDLDGSPDGFLYDAFISYCESDTHWVIRTLYPRLEHDFKLRVCIQDRDWIVGDDVVDNVIRSIERSRKTLFVVSNAFAVSHWCHFAVTMAQMRLFRTDRDNLVLVLLEEIADFNMNPRLQLQMEKRNNIEWTENRVGQQLFWDRLSLTLRRRSDSVMNSIPPREYFDSIC